MVIGLEKETYLVSEEDKELEVCAVVREGSIDRTITILLSTSDLTAKSKQAMV